MTLRHDISDSPLRRRLLGGYRPTDVAALAVRWRAVVDRLETELEHATGRAAELEEDVRTLRTRLESYISREAELNTALGDAQAHAHAIEEQARANARRTVQEAEGRAAELRAEAFARIATTGDQIDDLLRARDSLLGSVRAAVSEFDAILARIDRGQPPAPQPDAAPDEQRPAPQPAPANTADGEPARATVTAPDADRVYEGRVELDAGPFLDFAELSSFERALTRIQGVADVYVRRFVEDRATIEVTLGEPTLLVRVLAADLPFGFDVQSMDDEGLEMTLHALPPLKVG